MRPVDSARLVIAGGTVGLESVSVDLPMNGGEQGRLEAFGLGELEARNLELTALRNGVAVATAGFVFATARSPKSGSSSYLSRVCGVTLQDFTTLWNLPIEGGSAALGMPEPHERFQPVLYDIDKPLGSDLPDAAECEEKKRSGSVSPLSVAQLAAQLAGLDVHILPGPGFIPGVIGDNWSTAGKTVSQVLSELLFTNGVRWWLEGDLLIVDGREIPQGEFAVPLADARDVASEDWEDDFADDETAPVLADYLSRCVNDNTADEDGGGTFETNLDGVYNYFERSGTLGFGGAEGDYATVQGTLTKSGGRIVKHVEHGTGYVTTPDGRRLGPTYVKTVENSYHAAVPQALVESVERVRSYADLGAVQSLEGTTGGATEDQLELYRQLLAKSPYTASEKVTTQRWNAEGLLRVRTESSRAFSGVATRDSATGRRLELLYTDEERVEKWTPVGDGQYAYDLSGYTMVDRPVYEASDDPSAGAEAVGIISVRTPFSKREDTDSPPPSVSIPLPSCEQMDDCLTQAQAEYSRDVAAWRARQTNGASVRSHRVSFKCLKLNLRRGQLYGGGLIVSVSHRFARQSPGATEVTVIAAYE